MTEPHIAPAWTPEPGAIVILPELDPEDVWTEDEVYAILSGETPVLQAAGRVHVFHLPGEHDQSTHGSGKGVTGHDALEACKIGIGSEDGKVRGGYLTPEESMAMRRYRNTAYVRVNDYMRGKTPINPDDLDDAAVLAAAIKEGMGRSPLKQKITVTRGTKNDHWLPPEFQSGGGDLTGREFVDRGFVSTSARTDMARSFTRTGGVAMEITVPAGVGAIALSDFTDEAEILLDSGLTFRVSRDGGMIGGVRHLEVEVVA